MWCQTFDRSFSRNHSIPIWAEERSKYDLAWERKHFVSTTLVVPVVPVVPVVVGRSFSRVYITVVAGQGTFILLMFFVVKKSVH